MPRPPKVKGVTPVIRTGCGKLYLTDSTDPAFPEIFIRHGKAGGCVTCFCEALGRAISIGLQHGVPREKYVHTLMSIQCPSPQWIEGKQVLSCPDAIAKLMQENDKQETVDEPATDSSTG